MKKLLLLAVLIGAAYGAYVYLSRVQERTDKKLGPMKTNDEKIISEIEKN
jgi:hypothetical protein